MRPRKLPAEITRIGDQEADLEFRVVFRLYEFLWKHPENLNQIIHLSEEDIPDIHLVNHANEGPSTDTETQEALTHEVARFVDLTTIPGWPQEEQDLFRTRFLIRNEYDELDTFLDNHKSSHIVLLGQPGIGKTIYLTHCLLKRLVDGKPTFFAFKPTARYLFQDSGVYWAPRDSSNLSRRGIIDTSHPDRRVLFDLNNTQDSIMYMTNWKVLASTSPRVIRFKEWEKHNNAITFIMKTWEWEEIFLSRGMAIESSRSLNDWRAAFLKYGGSARFLLARTETQVNMLVREAIQNVNVNTLFRTDNMNDALIEVNPLEDEDTGKINRERMTRKLLSRFVYDKLIELNGAKARVFDTFEAMYRFLAKYPETAAAASDIFERDGHWYLFNRRWFAFRIRSLEDPSQWELLDLNHLKTINCFTGIGPLNTLDYTEYYRPDSSIFPGIDSFSLEVDDNGQITGIAMFQFTASSRHPTSATFLTELSRISNMPWEKSQDFQWKLIFVVPRKMEPEFKKQGWKKQDDWKWDPIVHQYVLGIEYGKDL